MRKKRGEGASGGLYGEVASMVEGERKFFPGVKRAVVGRMAFKLFGKKNYSTKTYESGAEVWRLR